MQSIAELRGLRPATCGRPTVSGGGAGVESLTKGREPEVLGFLAERALHTVYMAGLVRDNGLESPHNRGTFYACRDRGGRLEGVALIGHVTQVEARTDAAMKRLARAAQEYSAAHVIMGEQEKVARFWNYYAGAGQAPRLACRELLFEQRRPVGACGEVPGLRAAKMSDLPLVVPAQAAMAEGECGVNPLDTDPEGFRARCERRVRMGRVWVLVSGGELVFKADVMAETPEVVYVEGVFVTPRARGRGNGRRCLLQLGRVLLSRSASVCLLVNERNVEAHAFYRNAGYKFRGFYETIYLQR